MNNKDNKLIFDKYNKREVEGIDLDLIDDELRKDFSFDNVVRLYAYVTKKDPETLSSYFKQNNINRPEQVYTLLRGELR